MISLAWLSPYKWLLYSALLAALLAALVLGVYALDKSRQALGYDRAHAEYTAAALAATQAARAREQSLQSIIMKAQNDARTRETKLAADAASASAAADSLRDDLAAVRARLPGLTRHAVDEYASTASVVFEHCSREYSDLARQADGIASDRKTLIEAWPR